MTTQQIISPLASPIIESQATQPLISPVAAHGVPEGVSIPNRIFVGGIPPDTSADELKNFFSTFGAVRDTKIICDQAEVSKGYGFVTFETQDDAEKIIKMEKEEQDSTFIFKERKLNLGPAVRKAQRNYDSNTTAANQVLAYQAALQNSLLYDPNLAATLAAYQALPNNGFSMYYPPPFYPGAPVPALTQQYPALMTATTQPNAPAVTSTPQWTSPLVQGYSYQIASGTQYMAANTPELTYSDPYAQLSEGAILDQYANNPETNSAKQTSSETNQVTMKSVVSITNQLPGKSAYSQTHPPPAKRAALQSNVQPQYLSGQAQQYLNYRQMVQPSYNLPQNRLPYSPALYHPQMQPSEDASRLAPPTPPVTPHPGVVPQAHWWNSKTY